MEIDWKFAINKPRTAAAKFIDSHSSKQTNKKYKWNKPKEKRKIHPLESAYERDMKQLMIDHNKCMMALEL